MELGTWALIQNTPSLLGLVPLIVYIVLAFIIQDSMILPLAISLVVGFIMSGNGAVEFGQAFGTGMGGMMGQVGFLVLMGGGLGGVMNKVGVTTTLCKWIIKGFHIKGKKSAIVILAFCQGILTLVIGSAVTASAIAAPFMIPIVAIFGVHPITLAVVMVFPGFVGMLLSPFSAPNITAMELTGLSFGQYLGWAAGPFLAVMAVMSIVLCFWVEKSMDKKADAEVYTLTEEEKNYDVAVTPERKRATIAFLVVFVACVAWVIKNGNGLSFTFFYMILLTVVVAVLGKVKLVKAIDEFVTSASKLLQIFIICVGSQMMIDTVNAMGGFDALGEIFTSFVTNGSGAGITAIIATLVGAFGISGVASTQMIVIDQLFGAIIKQVGMLPGMWALVLVAGSYLTVVLYPSMTHFSALGLFRSKDMKTLLKVCWIGSGIMLAFCFAYFMIVPIIFG